ncbi:MAG: type II toxin-antitoxin system PemK/MazF family toxin, partial [Ruminococcaceae bacterium]|nr:type II toxin-antitoxin system PemK/MazF family toxin [Oscillospiraceae bacterium]
DSVILLEQVRTIDKKRLKEKMGHLDTSMMRQVNDALSVSFGLVSQPTNTPVTTGVSDTVPLASELPAFS